MLNFFPILKIITDNDANCVAAFDTFEDVLLAEAIETVHMAIDSVNVDAMNDVEDMTLMLEVEEDEDEDDDEEDEEEEEDTQQNETKRPSQPLSANNNTQNFAEVLSLHRLAYTKYIKCSAHTLQLTINDSLNLDDCKGIIGKITKFVAKFNMSTTCKEYFRSVKRGILILLKILLNQKKKFWIFK